MKELPLVSVIIPTYNHQDYVKEAILSVSAQDYPNLEVIVVDDGSTDKTPDIVKDVLFNIARPHKFIRQENSGAHNAINKGVSLSSGEFISILNSDDWYQKNRLSVFVAAACEKKADFIFSRVTHVGKDGEIVASSHPFVSSYQNSLEAASWFPTKSFELLRYNFSITTGNFFFGKELYEKIGGFEDYRLCHDWDFILKALIYCEPLFIDKSLMSYRITGENTIIVQNENNVRGEIETKKILLNYLKISETPENYLAPCRKNWNHYWSYFVKKHMSFAKNYEELNPYL